MKFALIGYPIEHSLSPKIYKNILGADLQYDLLNIADSSALPPLEQLALSYDGINITTPYKRTFIKNVEYEMEAFSEIDFINVVSFVDGRFIAANTDFLAVQTILGDYLLKYAHLKIILLGNGAMAELTQIIAESLGIPLVQLSRSRGLDMERMDLRSYADKNSQVLVINACSRNYIFQGQLDPDFLFWDYNYSYLPPQNTLASQVKNYQDGQALLLIQAKECIAFWKRTNPKLNY